MRFEHIHGGMHGGMHGALPFIFLFGLSRLLVIALIALLILSFIRLARRRRMHWGQHMHPHMHHTPHMDHPFEAYPTDGPKPGTPFNQPTALEILNRRYASGEIDAATFENMRERILGSHQPEQQ